MNKSELAVKLAKKVGLTQAKAAEVVDSIFNANKGIIAVELLLSNQPPTESDNDKDDPTEPFLK